MSGRFRNASAWAVVQKSEPGGSCTGATVFGTYQTLDAAFDAVLEHDSYGCWKELVHGVWEIGREELHGWVRGDWFVASSNAQESAP